MYEIGIKYMELEDLDLDETMIVDDYQAVIPAKDGRSMIFADWSDGFELWSVVSDDAEVLASYGLPDYYENQRVWLGEEDTRRLVAYLEEA